MICQKFREKHDGCTECSQIPIITVSENKSKYSLNNPQRREVCKVVIDGCLMTGDQGKQCDYLLLSCDTSVAYFIELKGKDLSHAIRQLDQSIDQLSSNLDGLRINARVVLSKTQTPDLRTSAYIKFVKKIKRLGGTFQHKNKILIENLE
jgi:hypothetical protein